VSDLRERVAKQVCCEYPCQHPFGCFSHNHFVAADAAIALVRAEVLEEAARVAEGKSVEAAGNVYQTDKPGNFWDEDSVYGTGRRQAADAIRALKSKP
jgi:hypothetical protein